MKKYLYILFVASHLLAIQTVNAELVQRDLFNDGDGLLTYDTEIKVEWLDVRQTRNLSYEEVVAGIGGWAALGFRHGTKYQACELMNNAGFGLTCDDGGLRVPSSICCYDSSIHTPYTTLLDSYQLGGITDTFAVSSGYPSQLFTIHTGFSGNQNGLGVWFSANAPQFKDPSYGHYLYRPASAVKLEVSGGAQQECNGDDGNNILLNANVLISDIDAIDTITWTLDGDIVGNTQSLELFVSRGSHIAEVTLVTVLGEVRIDTVTILVEDTEAPVIHAAFINPKTGAEVTSIKSKQKAEISIAVSDACDASPSNDATYGIPAMNGEQVSASISRKDGSTKLTITGNTNSVELSVTAQDESGNTSTSKSILDVGP